MNGMQRYRIPLDKLRASTEARVTAAKKKKPIGFSFDSVLADLVNVGVRTLSSPKTAVGFLVMSVVIYYSYAEWPSTPGGKYCKAHEDDSVICQFIAVYAMRILGFLILTIPVVAARGWDKLTWLICVAVFVFFVPEGHLWQYVAQGVFLHVLIQARVRYTKIAALVVFVGLWLLGYLVLPSGGVAPTADWRVRHGVKEPHSNISPVVMVEPDYHAIHNKIVKNHPLTPEEHAAYVARRQNLVGKGLSIDHAPGGKRFHEAHPGKHDDAPTANTTGGAGRGGGNTK